MFVFFGIFKVEVDNTGDVIITFVDGEFDFLSFFVSILKDFRELLFVEDNFDVYGPTEATEEACYFILNEG